MFVRIVHQAVEWLCYGEKLKPEQSQTIEQKAFTKGDAREWLDAKTE